MNPYKAPTINIEPNQRQVLRVSSSIVIAALSVPAIYIVTFPVVGFIKDILILFGVIRSFEERIIVDSIITFLLLVGYFSLIFKLRAHHSKYICIFCGVSMFFYWGCESGFFWGGFRFTYPVWYEVNMAVNDLVAALTTVFWRKGVSSQDNIYETGEIT